jgi:hypothetical protein
MPQPRTLDDLLSDARAFRADDPGEEDREDQADRRRLAQAYLDAVERGAADGGFPSPALGPGRLHALGPGRPAPVSRIEHAARELRALCAWAVRSPRAADHIAELAARHQIAPDSALVFACLLHLAECDDQAEALWQFSAGAGKALSAECLHLLHTSRGELRRARHWAQQAATLDNPDGEARRQHPSPDGGREPQPVTSSMLLRAWRALRGPESNGRLTIEAFHAHAGTLSRAVTAAVQGLRTEADSGFGLLSWPDRTLADQVHHCLTT